MLIYYIYIFIIVLKNKQKNQGYCESKLFKVLKGR